MIMSFRADYLFSSTRKLQFYVELGSSMLNLRSTRQLFFRFAQENFFLNILELSTCETKINYC